jgi:predicted nucleic acid-binding protein
MIVIADTSPRNYLIQIDCDSLLPKFYERVYVPPAVIQELISASSPKPRFAVLLS